MEQSWINETMSLLEEMEAEKAVFQRRQDEISRQIQNLDHRIDGAKALIQKYRMKYGVSPLPLEDIREGQFGNMTYPQVLRALAEKNDGYLRVADAVAAILKAGYAMNKEHAQPSIYSTLGRLKNQFTKVRPGEYRLATPNGKPPTQAVPPEPVVLKTRGFQSVEKGDEELKEEDLPF